MSNTTGIKKNSVLPKVVEFYSFKECATIHADWAAVTIYKILRFGTKVQKIGHLVGALENQPVILSTKIIWSTYQILLKAGFLKIKFGSCAYRN